MKWEYFQMAFEALVANKARTLLSMLGIIIGVSTVIVVVGIGIGSQEKIKQQYKNMNVESIMVMGNFGPDAGRSKLGVKDVEAVLESAQNIAEGTATIIGNTDVSFEKTTNSGNVMGIQANFFKISNLTIQFGREMTPEEANSRDKVAVLGWNVATILFDENPEAAIGQNILVNMKNVEVIGVLKQNGVSNRMASYDDSVFMPFETVEKNILGSGGRLAITFLATTVEQLPQAMEEVTQLLRTSHRLKDSAEDDFRLFDAGSMITSATESAQTMTILLTSIAAIVLIVSGIGIMNVMFVTVAERTKEIGVMKAIGARQQSILIQFLLESVLLSLMGGILGIIIGQVTIPFLNKLQGWYLVPSPSGVILAFVFSVTVGIFFGFYPALRASRLDPVDALRSE